MTLSERLKPKRLDGSEVLTSRARKLEATIQDFWRWSVSDLVSNTTRGRLAEFIVAQALGVDTSGVRDEWAPYDLETPEGIRVEVKSSAYVQAWAQRRPSTPIFGIRKARAWDADTGRLAAEPSHAAHVYVFALLGHPDRATLDPFDLDQWEFHAVATPVLEARTRSQHSITLMSLQRLAKATRFEGLREAVRAAHGDTTQPLPG